MNEYCYALLLIAISLLLLLIYVVLCVLCCCPMCCYPLCVVLSYNCRFVVLYMFCCPLCCFVALYILFCSPLHVGFVFSSCFVILYMLFYCPACVVLLLFMCCFVVIYVLFCCPLLVVLSSSMSGFVVLYEWFCCPLYVSTTLHWARTGVFPAEDNTKLSSYRNSRAVTVPEYSLVQRQAGCRSGKRQSYYIVFLTGQWLVPLIRKITLAQRRVLYSFMPFMTLWRWLACIYTRIFGGNYHSIFSSNFRAKDVFP